jgi:hypothetical protein
MNRDDPDFRLGYTARFNDRPGKPDPETAQDRYDRAFRNWKYALIAWVITCFIWSALRIYVDIEHLRHLHHGP